MELDKLHLALSQGPYAVSDDALQLIKQHVPQVKSHQDVPLWIGKSSNPEFLHMCLKSGVMAHVADWRVFIKSINKLALNPYLKDGKGEDPNEYMKIRDLMAKHLSEGEQVDVNTRRYSFATWALWNHPNNKSKMYMPVTAIVQYCSKQGLDFEEFYMHLRKHPGGARGVMISSYLFDAESHIQQLLEGATTFGIEAPELQDLDPSQNACIKNMLQVPFSALQGGAGVGKTTTVGKLILTLEKSQKVQTIFCLAFTHKAKRCIMEKLTANGIEEGANIKVSTIHSFIATYSKMKLPPCFILLDESSMIDIELLAGLAAVIKEACPVYQLAFVGDMMQLPPITRGEFFRHLVSSGGQHVNELTKCYRTDQSDLFQAYEDIRSGKLPASTENFKVLVVDNYNEINSQVGKLVYQNINRIEEVQFIAWQNKDVYKINQWVQQALLKSNKIGPSHYKEFYKGDKVIYRGDNSKTLTNALIGKVIDTNNNFATIRWEDGQQTNTNKDNIRSIKLAYALTVHCLQGSECNHIIVACYDVDKMKYCLDRRFLYTGVTRGKKTCVVVTTANLADMLAASIKTQPLTGIEIPKMPKLST